MSQSTDKYKVRESKKEKDERSQQRGTTNPVQRTKYFEGPSSSSQRSSSSPKPQPRPSFVEKPSRPYQDKRDTSRHRITTDPGQKTKGSTEIPIRPHTTHQNPNRSSKPEQEREERSQRKSTGDPRNKLTAPHEASSSSHASKDIPETRPMNSHVDRPPKSRQEKQEIVAKSRLFKTEEDVDFAARQTRFESLAPPEQKIQDQWAQFQLKGCLGACQMGFQFLRNKGGYRCSGGGHFVSDDLIAEGKGRYYTFDILTRFRRRHIQSYLYYASRKGEISATGQTLNKLMGGDPSTWANNSQLTTWLGPWSTDNPVLVMLATRQYVEPKLNDNAGNNTLHTPKDQAMAIRYLDIDTMADSEREKHDIWAQSQLKLNKCKANSWVRDDGGTWASGYVSGNGKYKVTDGLLAEGLGGFYLLIRNSTLDLCISDGPHYSLSTCEKGIEKSCMDRCGPIKEYPGRGMMKYINPLDRNRFG